MKSNRVKLSPEAAQRQGNVTRFALETLGNKDAVLAYLNSERPGLGGRPLDLATSSAAGLKSVQKDLATFARAGVLPGNSGNL